MPTVWWSTIDPEDALEIVLPTPGIVGPLGEDGQPCPWPWDPLARPFQGMYHCRYCGSMCVGGMPHPDYRTEVLMALTYL